MWLEHFQCKSKDREASERVLRVVQQQHYGVELLPGPIISSQRDYEVVETISCSLRRHYNQLIFEAVRFGVLKAVVCAALGREEFNEESVRLSAVLVKGQIRMLLQNDQNPKACVQISEMCRCAAAAPYRGECSRMELSAGGGGKELESCRCRASLEGSPSQNWRKKKKNLQKRWYIEG